MQAHHLLKKEIIQPVDWAKFIASRVMEIGDSPAALNSISSSFQGCEGGHFWRLSPLFALESYPVAWLRIGICQDAGLLYGAAPPKIHHSTTVVVIWFSIFRMHDLDGGGRTVVLDNSLLDCLNPRKSVLKSYHFQQQEP